MFHSIDHLGLTNPIIFLAFSKRKVHGQVVSNQKPRIEPPERPHIFYQAVFVYLFYQRQPNRVGLRLKIEVWVDQGRTFLQLLLRGPVCVGNVLCDDDLVAAIEEDADDHE